MVGASGADNTTFLRLLNRLEEPTAGTVTFQDRPLPDWNVLPLRRRVTLVGQQPVLLTDTVLDDLRVGRADPDRREAAALLDRAHLSAAYVDRATTNLSGGEAQRVRPARALAVSPQALLLDEPTSALDAVGTAAVEGVIRELVAGGLTVVLVSHNTAQTRRLSDHVLVLDHGRLAEQGEADHVDYLKEPASTPAVPTWAGVAASAALALLTIAVAWHGRLRLAREITVAAVRAAVQLAAVGAILLLVFRHTGLAGAIGRLALMVLIGGRVAARRAPGLQRALLTATTAIAAGTAAALGNPPHVVQHPPAGELLLERGEHEPVGGTAGVELLRGGCVG
ncbi:ABC transporter permease [Streptomyces sp. NPDC003233]